MKERIGIRRGRHCPRGPDDSRTCERELYSTPSRARCSINGPVDTPNIVCIPFVISENISIVNPVPVGKDGLPSELGMINIDARRKYAASK